MAGRGSRFSKAGYSLPKPLIPIHKKSMIQCVIENITPNREHNFIFICLDEHLREFNMETVLTSIVPNCRIIGINEVTEGAACTVLSAREYINNEEMLMIANSDQFVDVSIDCYLDSMYEKDGLIMTMKASHPKWSYIIYDENKMVKYLQEKKVISDEATVGIYNFRQGKDYVYYAEKMIEKNTRTNGEFYVAPVYNEMISDEKKIYYYNVGAENKGMYGLGTPEDLHYFRSLHLSEKY